ncbi:hypothetical protein ILYODFUR_006047 [Ilyodon furcidens]|uniref:Uncharacterized protein n=1 Tax=Ilyodon furcidens TaxID=33524 RepID=A0ABV0SJQ0_9TELE
MNLLTFLYHTNFQLSSSSNGLVEQKFACKLLSLQICASVRHAGNGNESLFSAGFIIPGDFRAAMSVELRMSNCAPKMDDSNSRESLYVCILFYTVTPSPDRTSLMLALL